MVPEVLDGVLWLARLGLRSRTGVVRAGHGYADPNFRPSSLPYVSLVGPLTVDVEPERDLPVASDVLVQLPGFVRGAPRAAQAIAAGSTLELRFDRDATAVVSLAAGDFATPANAAAVCADLEAKLRDAAATGGFRDEAGAIVVDPVRVAELGAITCRWDESNATVVVSSGRHGYVARIAPSLVEITGGTAAPELGFTLPARGRPGQHLRHRAPAPKAFSVDVRLDLWSGNQRDLGHLVDALVSSVPTRTRIVTRPALLSVELAPGDTELRLLETGEPTMPESLLHLEAADGFLDRVTDAALDATAGATAPAAPPRLRFAGAGVASKILARTPVVPDPRRRDALAPRGAALALGLRLDGAAAGHAGRLAALRSGGADVLTLDYEVVAPPGPGAALVVDLTGRALFRDAGGVVATASAVRRVPLDRLAAGAPVHVVAQSGPGAISIFVDAVAHGEAGAGAPPFPAVDAPGVFAVADDLSIALGNPASNPAPFELDHVHLFASPLPPLDPRLRGSTTAAAQFRPGDLIALGASERGLMPTGVTEAFYVRAVRGDTVELDRPVARRWRRGRTLVHARDCFIKQREIKRRDDLMNRLYRYCISYRVSALLEQPDTPIIGGLVIEPVVEVLPSSSSMSAAGAPGVRARVLDEPIAQAIPKQPQE